MPMGRLMAVIVGGPRDGCVLDITREDLAARQIQAISTPQGVLKCPTGGRTYIWDGTQDRNHRYRFWMSKESDARV